MNTLYATITIILSLMPFHAHGMSRDQLLTKIVDYTKEQPCKKTVDYIKLMQEHTSLDANSYTLVAAYTGDYDLDGQQEYEQARRTKIDDYFQLMYSESSIAADCRGIVNAYTAAYDQEWQIAAKIKQNSSTSRPNIEALAELSNRRLVMVYDIGQDMNLAIWSPQTQKYTPCIARQGLCDIFSHLAAFSDDHCMTSLHNSTRLMILDPNVERLTLLGTLPKSFATALLTIDSNAYMVGTKDGDLESGDRRTKRTNTFKRKDTSTSEERTRAGIIRALVRIDEHRIASTEANVPHVRIWDLRHAGRELHTIRDTTPSPRDRVWATNPTPHAIDSIALMPNGNLVTNSSRKAITVWSPTWQRIKTIRAIDGNRISTYKELMPITHRYVMGAAHSVTLDLIDIDHGTCTKMPNIFANTMTSLHDRSLALGAYDGITILNPPPAIMIPWLLTQRMRTSNEADHAVDDANQHSQ